MGSVLYAAECSATNPAAGAHPDWDGRLDFFGNALYAGAMRSDELDYELPPDRIAQHPPAARGASRLLVVDRAGACWADRMFQHLPDLLRPGDLLVVNNTRVLPARFWMRRSSGGLIEGLWTASAADGTWEVLLRRAGRLRIGERLRFEGTERRTAVVLEARGSGHYRLGIEPAADAETVLGEVGHVPLPHYIKRSPREDDAGDRARYQTIYASQPGAVAAPTAGLHFDAALVQRLRDAGVELWEVTLHVGMGTFAPITVEHLEQHRMHAEQYAVTAAAWSTIESARKAGRRIVAVGTTTVRVLETIARSGQLEGSTSIFILPGFEFQLVQALITNFHLPRSTLLALVYAFGGQGLIRSAYEHAVQAGYRFYSYGDAMLIQ